MEQFNLERALAGKPICTRDGRDVTQLTKFDVKEKEPIYGVLDGEVHAWYADGSFFFDSFSCENDLFMKSKENAIWVNVFKRKNGDLYISSTAFNSKVYAEQFGKGYEDYLKPVKIDDKIVE
jgi:hypothetical protein